MPQPHREEASETCADSVEVHREEEEVQEPRLARDHQCKRHHQEVRLEEAAVHLQAQEADEAEKHIHENDEAIADAAAVAAKLKAALCP